VEENRDDHNEVHVHDVPDMDGRPALADDMMVVDDGDHVGAATEMTEFLTELIDEGCVLELEDEVSQV
jgi:hypothetical protein